MDLSVVFAGLSAIATISAAAASLLLWRTSRRQAEMLKAEWNWKAFHEAELLAASPTYLEVHGLTQAMLAEHGLTPEKLKYYLLITNMAWHSRLRSDRFRRLNRKKFGSFEEGVNYVLRQGIDWPEGYRLREILESHEFARAWPLLRGWWIESPSAKTSQLIEAAVRRGRARRGELKRTDGV